MKKTNREQTMKEWDYWRKQIVEGKGSAPRDWFECILDRYIEALQWCSGSQDFQIEGKARKGWEKIVQPLIQDKGRNL